MQRQGCTCSQRHPSPSPPPPAAAQDANSFTCIVITDTGKIYGKFLGLVTSKEVDFESDHLKTLGDVMTKWVIELIGQLCCGWAIAACLSD
eukprot:scaffold32420_cov20-Tisochrysis_lutea.AAC.4